MDGDNTNSSDDENDEKASLSTDSNEETIDSTADRFNRAAGLYLEIFDSLASTPMEGIQLTSGEFFYQDSFEWQLWAIDN